MERDGNGLILALLFNIFSDYTGWSSAVFHRMSEATSIGDLFQEMVVYHSSMGGGKNVCYYDNICNIKLWLTSRVENVTVRY